MRRVSDLYGLNDQINRVYRWEVLLVGPHSWIIQSASKVLPGKEISKMHGRLALRSFFFGQSGGGYASRPSPSGL